MKQTIYLADHYFTGEVLTWELDRPSHSRQGSHVADCPFGWGWPLQSTSLVCPSCNKVWARLAVEGQHRHHFTPAVCSAFCADLDEQFIPGSLLSNLWLPEGIDWDLYPLLPRILQEREARLALEYLECQNRDPDIGSAVEVEAGAYLTASSTSASPSATSASQPSASPSP